VRGLTVRQPWAEAIACGAKLVENRTMSTRYRGPLAIHAGKAWAVWGRTDPRIRALWPGAESPAFLFGVVLAVAELVDVHPAAGCCHPWGEGHYAASDGRRRSSVHHWVLEDVRRLERPLPARGRLGLWTPDPVFLPELAE
jgi:hypothetical protein